MTDNLFADISSNNSGFAAKPYAAAGHLCVAIKATEGVNYTNPKYGGWVADAHRHGLGVLHYHFARPESGNPDGQAAHFWQAVKPHFRRPGDFVVVDVETGAAEARAFTLRYDKHLKAISDTHPILYTFLAMYNEQHLTISSDRLWIAAWGANNPAGRDWKMGSHSLFAWQYSDGINGPAPHSFAGIPGTCDGSRLNPATTKALRAQHKH